MAEGDPIGADLCSGTFDGDTLSELNNFDEKEITLGAGTALTSGIQYAIVIRNSAVASENAITISGQIFPNASYAGGYYADSDDAGSSWSQDDWIDVWFKTKAAALEKDTYTDTGWQNRNVYGNNWFSQIFTASSSYTITSVILRLSSEVGGTPGTITVSIKAVSAAGSKATTPSPTNANTSVTLDQTTISWADGGDSDSFDVYYGIESGNLTKVSDAQVGLSYTITDTTNGSPFEYLVTRYWRIDSTNDAGTVTGDEWSFTTIRLDPPGVTYFYPTGGYYYRLLIDTNGDYGDPPPGGVENTDYVIVTYEPNFIRTNRKLVAIAENRLWYEDI